MNFTLDEPQTIIDEHLQACPDALLFVGMGVGKTAACLHRLNDLFLSCESMGALIIAPMRVANLTWPMEIAKWDQFSWMKVANLRTEAGQRAFLNGTAHIYLINYDAIKALVSLVERRGRRGLPYDVVLFDELTKAKNPGSKRINLYRRKVPRAARHWGLTGTPMPNSWMDLFAQVRLVDDGARLGNNFRQFKVESGRFEEVMGSIFSRKSDCAMEGNGWDRTSCNSSVSISCSPRMRSHPGKRSRARRKPSKGKSQTSRLRSSPPNGWTSRTP